MYIPSEMMNNELVYPPVHFHYRMGVLEPLYKSVFYIKIVSHDDLVCLHVVVI